MYIESLIKQANELGLSVYRHPRKKTVSFAGGQPVDDLTARYALEEMIPARKLELEKLKQQGLIK